MKIKYCKKFILLLILSFLLGVSSYAQTVSKVFKNTPLKTALKEVETQTGFSIIYEKNVINEERTVTATFEQTPLQEAMSKILDKSLDFSIKNKMITIFPRQMKSGETKSSEQAPKKKYSGLILDEKGESIIGASVSLKGNTSVGTITDVDGNFSIEVPVGSILYISYIGFTPQEIKLGDKTTLDIVLKEDSKLLDEVVVVGYGVQNKRDVSTAISQVKAEDIADKPVTDFRQALVGKMPGVQVTQPSGDPEGAVSIRVRGVSSATAGNDPLYIVDGMPMERGFANLNSNDIESIEVLKDASSAAIYGSRGSNGVILITTKRGSSEKLTVKYDGYFGLQTVSKKLPMMNAYQFAEVARDAHNNAYLADVPTGSVNDPNGIRPQSYHRVPAELYPYLTGETGLVDTDWQDEIFRTAPTTSHNISLSGKGKNIGYFVSGNYYKQEGVIIESDFEKYSLRLNLDGKYDKFKFGVNFSPSYSTSNRVDASGPYGSGGIVQSALAMPPLWPVYNSDGSFNYLGNGYWRIGNDYQHNEVLNPVAIAKLQSDVVDRYALVGKIYGEYEFLKGLTYRLSLGGDYYGAHNDKYRSSELPKIGYSYYDAKSNPVGSSSSSFFFNWLVENQISYNTTFDEKHNISAVLVQSAQKETKKGNFVEATDYPNDYIQTITGGTVKSGTSEKTQWSLASYLARVQYSFMGRYMASAAIRADGSSRFGKNNRWGYFPSASVAWRISDEGFFKEANVLNFIDDLKLRTSYGATGNFQIGNYEHLSTMAPDDYILGHGDGNLISGYKPDKIENNDLTWEKTSMVNVGLDVQALKGLIGLSVEYYYSNTTDMLLNVPVPQITGYTRARMNVGKVNNRGWEIQLTSQKKITKDLNYSFTANYAKNTNEVKALGPGNAPIEETGGVAHAYYITEVGKPIGSYYLMVQDGIFENEEQLKQYPHFANTKVGDFRFVDVDGDGVLDVNKDRTIVGNYMPDFTYGFSGTINYRDFDLGFNFQGVYGNEILNLNRRYIDNMEGNVNGTTVALDRWRSSDNPGNGQVNRANRKTTGNNGRTSTWHIEDGSYFRLQNLTIGYTLPKTLTQRWNIDRLRVYASGQNLWTSTNYSGYNPEVSRRPDDALTPGEDYGTYPLAKVYTFGLNLTF
ncbi:SusC/RagA family TonB-linked outer membrane protein [Dysgonomonas sp. Marseille-P4677]|uniref:SusC/RagA family TonB-linked outer membrane protein n=1 Tax=Dysgonomonas sp. Marseille-P4677 TaxID=2364790 RepID=UPI0019148659|nr:SusC/RagA family TonB-linked outer membrane protein [Dysgonomonas sp. Marseille-P4677]MBK5722187.1 SusC/RagA family TonB-linked outer membrane protein [Dysgonomonas sp. Marseille-P4677]